MDYRWGNREHRYTEISRAIGATVSAGALHAQGWGFESLIAHPLNCHGPSNGAVSCLGPSHGIRTRKGAELRKREAFSSGARKARSAVAKAGGGADRDIPHRPPLELSRPQQWGRFSFGSVLWDSNPHHLSPSGTTLHCFCPQAVPRRDETASPLSFIATQHNFAPRREKLVSVRDEKTGPLEANPFTGLRDAESAIELYGNYPSTSSRIAIRSSTSPFSQTSGGRKRSV